MPVDPVVPAEGVPEEVAAAAPSAPVSKRPFFDRSAPLFAAFLVVAAVALSIALATVHQRTTDELTKTSTSARSHVVISNWLEDGYFHYVGMINRNPDQESIYRNSTGGYMISGFVIEKIYSTMTGHYSYRLLALHNQFVSMVLSALAGLLSFRLVRRIGLEPRLAFAAGASVVAVLFTFPDNLDLYWEMSAQAYGLLFALLYLVIEERHIDVESRPRIVVLAQAATVFTMTVMESIAALGFVVSIAATLAILGRRMPWKRFLLTAAIPFIGALTLYQLQLKVANVRFPDVPTTGSTALFRTGMDGDAKYYGDHLGIATRRDVPRRDWPNSEHLFNWKWVFILGVLSVVAVVIAFIWRRVSQFMVEVLAGLIGAWLVYAAIFSQAIVIHPYLYDVLLFTPLCIALFALAPALLESMTRRTGAIILVIVFSALWYSFFQLRLYALRRPLPRPDRAAVLDERTNTVLTRGHAAAT